MRVRVWVRVRVRARVRVRLRVRVRVRMRVMRTSSGVSSFDAAASVKPMFHPHSSMKE